MDAEPTNPASPADQPAIEQDVFCPQCTYNLRGLTGSRCPECGREFDRAALTASLIPWTRRKAIGRFRAYWQTVWMVCQHGPRLVQEFAVPVSYRDAQLFRWVTVLHAYLPVLALTAWGYTLSRPGLRLGISVLDWAFRSVWYMAPLHAAILVSLAAITGLPSYFFHPRGLPVEEQNRAVALSYYAAGPLAWTPLAACLAATCAQLASLVIIVPEVILWWWSLVALARHVMGYRPGRVVLVAVGLPLLWVLTVLLICYCITFLVLFSCSLWSSLG